MTSQQAFSYGAAGGILDNALRKIPPPKVDVQEKFIWNLVNVTKFDFREKYVATLDDDGRKQLVEGVLEKFSTDTLPILQQTDKQWVHGDMNEQNVLFAGTNVSGIIDFDDLVYSHRVVDLATAL